MSPPVQLELALRWRDPKAFLASQPTFLCQRFKTRMRVTSCIEAQTRQARPGRDVADDSFCRSKACLEGFEYLVAAGLARWERCAECAGRGRRPCWTSNVGRRVLA